MSCIFCLTDTPKIIKYNGICNCHPNIHSECLDVWDKTNPYTCPICLIKKEQYIIIYNGNQRDNPGLIFVCCCCCLSILVSPIIFMIILISYHSFLLKPNDFHNRTRI